MINIVSHEGHAFSSNFSGSVLNPEAGNLLVVTVHLQAGVVNSLTYAGVAPTLIVAATADWPQTYIYVMPDDDLPQSGQTHSLEIGSSSPSGAVTITKIAGADLTVPINNWPVSTVDDNGTSMDISVSVESPAACLVLGALTHRDGCPADGTGDGELLSAECFDSPRGYAVSARSETQPGTYSLGWKWGVTNRRRVCAVAIPMILLFVSGTIYDRKGNPCKRKVYAMRRPTDGSAPHVLAHGQSDPTTGAYELTLSTDEEVTLVVVAEDEGTPGPNDPVLPDLCQRVIPG